MGICVRLCSDWCLREADILSDYPQTSVSCIVRTQYPYFAQRYAGITGFGPLLLLLLNCNFHSEIFKINLFHILYKILRQMILQFSRMINHPGFSGKCSPVFVDHGNVVEFRIVAEKAAVGYDTVSQIVEAFGNLLFLTGRGRSLFAKDKNCSHHYFVVS